MRIERPDRKTFTEAWFNENLSRSEIADMFCLSQTTTRTIAKEFGLPMERPGYMDTRTAADPTPEEIAERAAEIRKGWTNTKRERRNCFDASRLARRR